MAKIEIKNVYKIFGDNPSKVLPMVKEGATKEEVLEKTGHTVGLDNVSISVEEGETFVCMGLSGSGKSTLIRHINRLIDPTSGEVSVEGTNVMQLDQNNLIELDLVILFLPLSAWILEEVDINRRSELLVPSAHSFTY